jgi:hypothetical protein
MAFDLWEGGQYTYLCALGVVMVLLLLVMAFTARQLAARVEYRGIADRKTAIIWRLATVN